MVYLGLDWGIKKIGVALSEGQLSSPLTTLEVHSLSQAIHLVKELVRAEKVDLVVIGQPEGKMGQTVKMVSVRLQEEGIKVVLTDETLSTQSAKQVMIETGVSRKDRKSDDAVSAALILQNYLDEK